MTVTKHGRAALLALIAATFLGITMMPSTAHAGVATIYQCRTPSGPADVDLMSASGNAIVQVSLTDCRNGGTAWMLSAAGKGAPYQVGQQDLKVAAPDGMSIVGGRFYRRMVNYAWVNINNDKADSWGFGYVLKTASGQVLERCGLSESQPSLGNCGPAVAAIDGTYTTFATDYVDLPATAMPSFTASVGCVFAGDRCNHHYNNPGLSLISAKLNVRDSASPATATASGPLATSDSIRSGDEALNVAGTDPAGLGVYQAEVLVDGATVLRQTVDDGDGMCADADTTNSDPYEFASGHPCPQSASGSMTVSNLPEGRHHLKVMLYDAAGNSAVALDRPNLLIDRVPAPTNTGLPTLSGTVQEGRTLGAGPGSWDVHGAGAASFAYQWQRCGADGLGCVDIDGATSALRDLTAADVGKRVRVRVTGSNAEGDTPAHSEMTPLVATRESTAPPEVNAPPAQTTPVTTPITQTPAPQTSLGAVPSSTGELGPDPRPQGTPNGTNAGPEVRLSAFDAATESRSVRVRYGRTFTIAGRLVAPSGAPVAGARLEVLEREDRTGATLVKRGEILSDADGRFRYLPAPGPSRTIRIGYKARVGDSAFARTTDVTVKVVASIRFGLSRRALRNGQTLRYTGKVLGPRTGHRFVEVQVRNGKSWQIVCSVRTDAKGAFGCAHRFRRTTVRTTYTFRARVRKQSGLPYEASTSIARKARVRP